jgi:PAS domain S-box-containing protein
MKINSPTLITDDTNLKLKIQLLQSILVGLVSVSIGFIILAFFAARELLWRASITGGLAIILCVVAYWLLRRRHFKMAGTILVGSLWIIVSVMSFSAGGVHAPIFIGYLVIIMLGELILGIQTGTFLTIISVLFGGYLIYAESIHILPPPLEYSSQGRLLIYVFFFFTGLFLQRASVNTTRKAIEKAHASESQYKLFLENIPTITYINDTSLDALTLYVSPQVVELLGYTREEFINDPKLWTKLVLAEDWEYVNSHNQHSVETGAPFFMEYRLVTKSGDVIWIRDEARLVHDENGKPKYWLGVWTDITAAKDTERTLGNIIQTQTKRTNQLQTASEVSRAATSILELNELLPKVVELIRSHFDYYYVGIFLVDEKREMAELQAATGEMGRKMLDAHHSLPLGNSSMIGWCIAHDQARIALDVGKEAVRFKNPLLPLTRSELALPLRSHGEIIGAMTIQSALAAAFTEADITALQTMADQVANAIETARLFDERAMLIGELETKNAELERYTYTVSHDLKSPLVTIRGYLGYLRDDATKGDMNRFSSDMNRIVKATETMQALLNDLLELSRVGRVINPSVNVAFDEIAKDAINLALDPQKREKIKIELQGNLPIIHCDRTRVMEVIQNLLSNSVKFMDDQPEPFIQIGTNGVEENTLFPIFYVRDNGMGIDPKYHEKVFGLFNRLDQEKEGTGIGLTLVKRIIEVHGGRIWLESEGVGKGSTFYFTLPPATA